jgi:hypothetical protein
VNKEKNSRNKINQIRMNKKSLILFVCLFLAFFASGTVLAADKLEVTYPQILGLPHVGPNSSLANLVGYWFGLLVYATGGIAIISFAIGAIQLMMSPNPEMVGNAKDRMIGSVIGLTLTISAFVILRTINPALVEPVLENLPTGNGVFLTSGSKYIQAPGGAGDVSLLDPSYDLLLYKCDTGRPLLVWLYSQKDFKYSSGDRSIRITCGGSVNIGSAGSYKWAYEVPGVYYCLNGCSGDMCSGYMSEVRTTSQEQIEEPFKNNIKGVRVVNDTNASIYYGAIMHKEIGLANGGACTQPIYFENNGGCRGINIPAFSADIYAWNKADPVISGDGVTLYSETYGWNADVESGGYEIYPNEINKFFTGNSEDFEFDWTDVESTDAALCNEYPDLSCWEENPSNDDASYIMAGACCPCMSFKDCSGSMRIKGDYLVALYSDAEDKDGNKFLYCQTFAEDVENLDAYDYVQPGSWIKYINIIPTITN